MKTKYDPKEIRPAIETNGMGFDEILKRIANTNPKEIPDSRNRETAVVHAKIRIVNKPHLPSKMWEAQTPSAE